MQLDEHKKIKSGNAEPMHDKIEGTSYDTGGKEREDICDHGWLVQKLAEDKNEASYELSWKVKVMVKRKRKRYK